MTNATKVTLSKQDQEFIKDHYQTKTAGQIANHLQVSRSKVSYTIYLMKLKRPYKGEVKRDTENEFWSEELHKEYFG